MHPGAALVIIDTKSGEKPQKRERVEEKRDACTAICHGLWRRAGPAAGAFPEGFRSLRPVLRINAEVRDGKTAWVEFNTDVESEGKRGWLNVGHWDDAAFTVDGKTTRFETGLLTISFTGVGI